MKVIFVAGSYGSGTSSLIGALDRLGISTLPPHFKTSDPRTPISYESKAFRALIHSFAREDVEGNDLRVDRSKSAEFVEEFRVFIENADPGPANAIALKMPLASICLPEIMQVVDPYVVWVHRPMDEIEASRIRRKWPALFGSVSAAIINETLIHDLVENGKSFLSISYHDLTRDGRGELLKVLDYCGLRELEAGVDEAAKFIRNG